MNTVLGPEDIQRFLPHRPPFLFLATAEWISDDEIRGTALWPADHPILAGHFPGKPIVPGVCLVESAAQLAGAYVGMRLEGSGDRKRGMLGVLASIRNASFHHPVLPDSTLNLSCRLREMSKLVFHVKAQGLLSEQLAVSCELVFVVRSMAESVARGR